MDNICAINYPYCDLQNEILIKIKILILLDMIMEIQQQIKDMYLWFIVG